MSGFSKLLSTANLITKQSVIFPKNFNNLLKANGNSQMITQLRSSHGRTMFIRPGKFYTKKFWDFIHFNIVLAGLPFALFIAYQNLFVGMATLTEIPEDYEPRHWEYHRHPIRRFLAKYVYDAPERSYEITMHETYVEQCKIRMRKLEKKVKMMMKEKQDYKGWYFIPVQEETYEYKKKYLEEQAKMGYNTNKIK